MPGFELWNDEERKEVNDVLETGILMRYGFDGPRKGVWKSKELEEAICKKFDSKYAQLTSSGTSALTTVMAALGIGAGDEIIMPCFTFVASFESLLTIGAVPVLVDVDDTLTMNPDAVRKAITPKTKAVMPVHMCGSMADLHPFIGYNYRISELHAAVGLAQIRKVDTVLAMQKKNHALLKDILSQVPEISFRRIPDPTGDSCTFLSWFLPTEEITKAVINELKVQNILPGNFYWYDNNWHYIRKWDHLKNAETLNALHPDLKAQVIHHANKDFSASDAV